VSLLLKAHQRFLLFIIIYFLSFTFLTLKNQKASKEMMIQYISRSQVGGQDLLRINTKVSKNLDYQSQFA
jgi:hypothetical protein